MVFLISKVFCWSDSSAYYSVCSPSWFPCAFSGFSLWTSHLLWRQVPLGNTCTCICHTTGALPVWEPFKLTSLVWGLGITERVCTHTRASLSLWILRKPFLLTPAPRLDAKPRGQREFLVYLDGKVKPRESRVCEDGLLLDPQHGQVLHHAFLWPQRSPDNDAPV